MARIELRDATIRIKDGLSGTARVNDTMLAMGDTSVSIDTVALSAVVPDLVPIGARFKFAGDDTVRTVTARMPAGTGPTTSIDFAPAVGAMPPANMSVITFLPNQIDVKIGDGNLTYTENKEYEYQLDRGDLDTVREGNEVPMDVTIDFVYEFVTTGTGEKITPVDALKGTGGAAEWVSSSSDPCEPYAVDIEVEHVPPCGGAQEEVTLFPDFRRDSLEFDLSEATISVTGRCNAAEPIVTRADQS